jgi:hypothetical protein
MLYPATPAKSKRASRSAQNAACASFLPWLVWRVSMTKVRAAMAALYAVAVLVGFGCAPRVDPRVQAAEDFRSTVFDLIARDDAQSQKLNALRLGMSDQEVLNVAGAPSKRESRPGGEENSTVETWVYSGELSTLGTLTFRNGKLIQIQTD